MNELLSIAADWSFWDREVPRNVVRNVDLPSELRPSLALIIQGVRRCGKSTLMQQLVRRYGLEPTRCVFVNFEDPRLSERLSWPTLQGLVDAFRERHPEGPLHFFLDEIQWVDGWQRWLRSQLDRPRGCTFVISGSNARLLGGELGSTLTGRHLTVELFPFDLDEFRQVNVAYGQLAADAVLLQLSGRLQATLRGARGAEPDTADQLARLPGDEFAVLMRVQSPEEAQRGMERLLTVLGTPVAIRENRMGDGLALEISASLGATIYPQDDADPETLLRHAGHALYRAKRAGRGGIQFHDPTLDLRNEAGLIGLARLQQALDSDELLLHYQPQIDLRTGQVMGVEALLRWQHPERGLLAPAHFLPLAAPTGLSIQIGDWVIEKALQQAAEWLEAGLNGGKGLPVSVNVGLRQLNRPDFPQRLQELVQRQPAAVAHLLHLDVTEADALAETDAAQALIQRCLGLGVGIALDDFGASYSHLSSLKRLPVDTLKLDRSYVQGMLGDAQDLSLVESVIGLGRNIGCAVLAKGVESRAHARELLRLGCRLGQGNGIAAAMPPKALPDWVDQFTRGDWVSQLRPPTQARL